MKAIKRTSMAAEAPQDPATRYLKGGRLDECRFFDETFELMSSHGESLNRDLAGRLFLSRYELDATGTRVTRWELRQASFTEACAWLMQNGQLRPPQKFLAFHGIVPEHPPVQGQPAPAGDAIAVRVDLPGKETLDRLNAIATTCRANPARIAGAAVRRALMDPAFDEILGSKTAGPSLLEMILGPKLYATASKFTSRTGLDLKDLVLAVLWEEVLADEEVRATIRTERWFMPPARRLAKLALKAARKKAENSSSLKLRTKQGGAK
jgi:hypothetical protein